MKKTRYIKLVLMMMCMLILAGCQKEKAGEPSQTATEKTGKQTGESVYQYTSTLFDRTQIDGKMAVYFLRGDYVATDASDNEEASGESTLIIAPDGTTMLVDFNNCMINGAYIAEVMRELEIEKLDYVVVTSPHEEHIGGYSIVMNSVEIGQILTNHHAFTNNAIYKTFMNAVTEYDIPISTVYEGDTFAVGTDIQVEVLNPSKDYDDWGNDESQRNGALLLKLTYKKSSFLIGGDISSALEEQLIAKYGDKLQADVVKMNDQGEKTSNSKEWIKMVSPKIACGEQNVVASDVIVGRYALTADVSLHTALDGTCLVYTNGDGTYEVQVEKERSGDTYVNLDTENGHFTIQ